MKIYSEKLKNLILYILSSEDYIDGGIKKLNKILYFIDFYFYRDQEKLITDMKYAKAPFGPILDDYELIFKQLAKDKALDSFSECGCLKHKPKSEPNLQVFESQELNHINDVLKRYGHLSSADLESISHEQQPWILTETYGQIIDPDLALLIDDGPGESTEITKEGLKKELVALANKV